MKNNKCLHCNTETKNSKFCSRNCSAAFNNKTPKRKRLKPITLCACCNKKVRSIKKDLSDIYCQKCKVKIFKEQIGELTIREYTKRICLEGLHPSSKFSHIRGFNRSWNKDLTLLPCKICGYDKHVELHHIKPMSDFPDDTPIKIVNDKSNIVQLCRNCHWEVENDLIQL